MDGLSVKGQVTQLYKFHSLHIITMFHLILLLTGKTYSGSKPQGHAERMERYGGATLYSSTGANVDAERNKTELHGNPLKSR